MTCIGDLDHASDGRMAAYVCYDSKKYSDKVQNRILIIYSLMEYARSMDEVDPMKAFKKCARQGCKILRHPGRRKESHSQGEEERPSFGDNRARIFVMLCYENIVWELMMTVYDARRLTEQAFDTEKEWENRRKLGKRRQWEDII